MPAIYITKQGTSISKEKGRMTLFEDQEELFSTPWSNIDALIIFGYVQITSQVISMLLDKGIDTTFLTLEGKLKGQLIPQKSKNIPLRIKQYDISKDTNKSIQIAKNLIRQKILNQSKILKDYKSNHPEVDFFDAEYQINEIVNTLNKNEPLDINSLMGYEGFASKNYFDCMKQMFIGELKFDGRSKRPPKDEVNALLSLGYTLLGTKISALLYSIGFEPYIGFLHSIDYGRESLMLDVLELFRQTVIDKLVLQMCNKNMLKKNDFEDREGGIFLKIDSMKKFIIEFENWIGVQKFEDNTFYQKITKEVHNLSKSIIEDKEYIPFQTNIV